MKIILKPVEEKDDSFPLPRWITEREVARITRSGSWDDRIELRHFLLSYRPRSSDMLSYPTVPYYNAGFRLARNK